jgi:ATP-dependent DNA ligase I
VDEVPIAVAFLSGELTQRQIGVGYAALVDLAAPGEAKTEPALTLAETDAAFEAIGALAGPGSAAQRRGLLADLVSRATDAERAFLIRLIAGDLRQGALEGVMTEAVARAAGVAVTEVRRAHQLRGSLQAVARAALAAANGEGGPQAVAAALGEFTLQVGQPVKPMLAASAPDLAAAIERISPAAVEWKIDGIRVQVHKDGPAAWVFTRTLDDITERVPEVVAIALSLRADRAVIDGEVVALYPDGRPRPFQVTSARVASDLAPGQRRPAPAESVSLTAFLFDLLHVDGRDLIDEPASARLRRLAEIAPAELLIPRVVTSDQHEAAAFASDAIGRGHEGVVVKSLDAPYRAGRRGGDWIKVKPRTTLDLVILAAEWGHGRRRGWLSNLHLGARDPASGRFVMLGKTFKGLTDSMLQWQTKRLLELAESPAGLDQPRPEPAGRSPQTPQHGVVRVRPELVAEIAFDGVQASKRYPGGVTLRFARVLRYRPDKRVDEADTIDTVRALWSPAVAES